MHPPHNIATYIVIIYLWQYDMGVANYDESGEYDIWKKKFQERERESLLGES